MEAATVLQMPERDNVSPLTVLANEAHEMGVVGHRAVAEWILEKEPDILSQLDHAQKVMLLTRFIQSRGALSKLRSAVAGTWNTDADGSTEAIPRFAISVQGTAVWDSRWEEVGKETRELDVADIEHLKRLYRKRAIENMARIKWLDGLLDLMRQHKCSTAGKLEEKKVRLPSIEIRDEAGE